MDFYVYIDYEILFYYDFLIGKLIVWGYDCFIVIQRMKCVLRECVVMGVLIIIGFYQRILEIFEFIDGEVYINFIENIMK